MVNCQHQVVAGLVDDRLKILNILLEGDGRHASPSYLLDITLNTSSNSDLSRSLKVYRSIDCSPNLAQLPTT